MNHTFRNPARRGTLAACLTVLTLSAAAQMPAAESRIRLVTVYPGSATVERVARVVAGARQWRFTCLPASLDVQSLTVSAEAPLRVGELSVLSEDRGAVPACDNSPTDALIRELEDRKARLGAENDALGIVTGYLKGVAGPDGLPNGTHAAPDPKNVAAMADTLRRSGLEALTRQQEIRRHQEDLDRQLKPLLAERERERAGRARVVSVNVTLDAPKDGELRLSYQVNGPGWTPGYRALLDTRSGTLRLERQAQVAQATGEDWRGVAMRLSTGQPRRGTTGPQPHPWRIGIAPPPSETARLAAAPKMELLAPAPAAAPPQDASPTAGNFDVSVFQNAFATEFSVPQRIDVPSGGPRVSLTLGGHDTQAKLFTRTSPLQDASAWLVAELPRPEGVWPPGALQLYRDGAYVGNDTLRTGDEGPLTLSFGRDELVTVRVAPPKELRGSAGFAGTLAERRVERAYTVENHHRAPVQLQVLEASPVAVHEDVTVQTRFEPQPESLAWKDRPGVVLWSQGLAAGQSARFSASYTLTWPKDARIQESR